MSDIWVEDLDAELDAVEGTPTSSEIRAITDQYTNTTGVAVAVRRAMAGGGSSLPLSREFGQAEFDFNAESRSGGIGVLSPVTLTFSDGDADLVDLSTPTAPFVIAEGVYAYTATVSVVGTGMLRAARLQVDDDYYSIGSHVQFGSDLEVTAISVTWWCSANDPFFVQLSSEADGGSPDVFAGRVFVQRIT